MFFCKYLAPQYICKIKEFKKKKKEKRDAQEANKHDGVVVLINNNCNDWWRKALLETGRAELVIFGWLKRQQWFSL